MGSADPTSIYGGDQVLIMSLDEVASHLRRYLARQAKLLRVLRNDGRLRHALEVYEMEHGWFRGTDHESRILLGIIESLEEFQ